jgi:hypothetical protein
MCRFGNLLTIPSNCTLPFARHLAGRFVLTAVIDIHDIPIRISAAWRALLTFTVIFFSPTT